MRRTTAKALPCALLSMSLLLGPSEARAQTEVEIRYLDYHHAIYAAVLCEHRNLEQTTVDDPDAAQLATAHEKLAEAIDPKIEDQISAGRRLHLIEQAKQDVRDLKAKKGCSDPEMQRWLGIFHDELEPVLQD
jgi:hypothetical protein